MAAGAPSPENDMTVTQDAEDLVGTFTPELDAAAEPETETPEEDTMRPTEWLQRKLARIPEAKLKSPAVAAKLEQAKADLLALESSISSAAVEAANGNEQALTDYLARIEQAKKQVEFWNHAWGAARREDDDADRVADPPGEPAERRPAGVEQSRCELGCDAGGGRDGRAGGAV